MVAVMFMGVALIALLCVLAYTLAIYALPFFVGLAAAQFAYQTGSGLIGAGLVGLFSAGVAFGILAVLFETIRTQLGASRLFTIGIGSAPNSHFMRKAAEFGRGTFTHIGSTSEVKAQMDAIFRKLERPALTDLRIEGVDGQVEMFPARIPDLYEGEPVVAVLKGASLPDSITIHGMIGTSPWTTSIMLKHRDSREGLSVYWKDLEIMERTKVKKFAKRYTPFSYRSEAVEAFDRMFARFKRQTIVLSYSSNGYPDLDVLTSLLQKHKRRVEVVTRPHRYHFGTHSKVQRAAVEEYLIVGR